MPKGIALTLGDAAFAEPVVHVEPTTIAVAHWGRLGDGGSALAQRIRA